jgi:hypothetical protein
VCGCQKFFCNCCGLSYCNFGVVGFSFYDCRNLGLVVRIFFLALVVVWAIANLVLLIFFFLIFNFFNLFFCTCRILVWIVAILVLLGSIARSPCCSNCCDFSALSIFFLWLLCQEKILLFVLLARTTPVENSSSGCL